MRVYDIGSRFRMLLTVCCSNICFENSIIVCHTFIWLCFLKEIFLLSQVAFAGFDVWRDLYMV